MLVQDNTVPCHSSMGIYVDLELSTRSGLADGLRVTGREAAGGLGIQRATKVQHPESGASSGKGRRGGESLLGDEEGERERAMGGYE
jgi:hypothetical protein